MAVFSQKENLPISLQSNRIEGGFKLLGVQPKSEERSIPHVSIITAVRNGEHSIEKTMLSVFNQSYKNIEYIIIDGGSTDGTLDIIRKYNTLIAYWVSEPDNGISDAFNKGITASTGEFIGLLNADDWLSQNQIEQGVKALRDSSADFIFGDLLFHDERGNVLYRINGDPHYARTIRSKMPELCHPTVLARKAAYERIGLFDTNYHYAMDYEWHLRLHIRGGQGIYAKEVTGNMGLGGASDTSYHKALKEVRDISIRHGKNKFLAWLLYGIRLIKGTSRRTLEKILPVPVFDRVRRMFNPLYSGIDEEGRKK